MPEINLPTTEDLPSTREVVDGAKRVFQKLPSAGEVFNGTKRVAKGGADMAAKGFHAAEAVRDFDPEKAQIAAKKRMVRGAKNVKKQAAEKSEQVAEYTSEKLSLIHI